MNSRYQYNYGAHNRAPPRLQSANAAQPVSIFDDIDVDDYDDEDEYHKFPSPGSDRDDDDDDDDDDEENESDDNDCGSTHSNRPSKRKSVKKVGVVVPLDLYWNGKGPAKSRQATTTIFTDWSASDVQTELDNVLKKERLPVSVEQFRVSYVCKPDDTENIDEDEHRAAKSKRRKTGRKTKGKKKQPKSRRVQEISVYNYDFTKVPVDRIDHLVMRQMAMYSIQPVVPAPNTTATAHRNITRNSVEIKGMRQAAMALKGMLSPSEFDKLSRHPKCRDIYAAAKAKLAYDGCSEDEVKWWLKYSLLQIDQLQQARQQQHYQQPQSMAHSALNNITNIMAMKLLKQLSAESNQANDSNISSNPSHSDQVETMSASTNSSNWQSNLPSLNDMNLSPLRLPPIPDQQPSSYAATRAPHDRPVSNQRYNPMS